MEDIKILERLRDNAYGCAELEDDIDVSLQAQKEFWALSNAIKAMEELNKKDKILDKKDKIINLMAEQLITPIHDKKWILEYYQKKVEE